MSLKRVRTFVVVSIAIFFSNLSYSQNINPKIGSEKESAGKAASNVNYNTGVMNYSIPLLATGQDGYQIPVTLGYGATGIKVDEKPGVYGLGWTLYYGGGTISRSLRGLCADENKDYGILKHPLPATPEPVNDPTARKVNLSEQDGESDIFTLQVNGINVSFILQPSADTFVIKPIEKTNVKINCKFDNLKRIAGWNVIDEQGNQYLFDAYVMNMANVNTMVYSNGNRASYISSWYLTSVTCINNDNITFEYLPSDLVEVQNDDAASYAEYWPHMYRPDYDLIKAALGGLAAGINVDDIRRYHINTQIANLANSQRELTNNYFRQISDINESNFQSSLNSSLAMDYFFQLNTIDNQIRVAQENLNYNPGLSSLVDAVGTAYGTVREVRYEYKNSGQKNLYAKKLIKRISFRNTILEFDYAKTTFSFNNSTYVTAVISGITHRTKTGDVIEKVLFSINETGFLKSVKTLSMLNTQKKSYSFSYFDEGTTLSRFSQDYWGYYNGKPNQSLLPEDPNYRILLIP